MIRLALGAALTFSVLAGGCTHPPAAVPPPLQTAIEQRDALAISDALEALISEGKDHTHDRQLAYDQIKKTEEPTAAYAFARAAVTGRLVQAKGLTAALLVREMETFARKSRELDPAFREFAATRMLGTLYVLAPASLLANGDSEKGLDLLEGLVKAHPETIENHLRYAEALIALGDAGPATHSLCLAFERRATLRKDDQKLVAKLMQDAGAPVCSSPKP